VKHLSFSRDPALYLTLALAVAQLISMSLHLTTDQQNATSVIVTGVYTILLAVATRPVQVSAITGAIATIATAMGAYYVHIGPDWVSALNALVVGVFGTVTMLRVSPAPALARRTSDHDLAA
jgi:hypothetical protein